MFKPGLLVLSVSSVGKRLIRVKPTFPEAIFYLLSSSPSRPGYESVAPRSVVAHTRSTTVTSSPVPAQRTQSPTIVMTTGTPTQEQLTAPPTQTPPPPTSLTESQPVEGGGGDLPRGGRGGGGAPLTRRQLYMSRNFLHHELQLPDGYGN